ncbi:MAG: acyl carrier protein [candidate division Zixibacteria bacterium]|nr:acyl carrier protein [candidate division Zixibacteria bacterium]MDH3936769.1 acyl carrier protein [candidate division Zixibacteria bacterium]MDH4032779.1 acyl carrier protein [candidate division Zixibacteria bacterium]
MDARTQLKEFVVENFMMGQDASELSDSGSLLELGIIDSTGVLELVGFLEETYQFTVDDDDLVPDNLDSIDNLVKFVQRKNGS